MSEIAVGIRIGVSYTFRKKKSDPLFVLKLNDKERFGLLNTHSGFLNNFT